MAKYEVLSLIWKQSQGKYFYPGEIIELEDDAGKVLMDKQCVKPAIYRRRKEKEVKDDTNNKRGFSS